LEATPQFPFLYLKLFETRKTTAQQTAKYLSSEEKKRFNFSSNSKEETKNPLNPRRRFSLLLFFPLS
jgi:hypothetical protein